MFISTSIRGRYWRLRPATMALTILLVAAVTHSSPVRAEKLLRWKLQADESLQVQFVQESQIETTVNNKPLKMSIEMSMNMYWTVDDVDPQGGVQMTQSITRMQLKMDAASSGVVDYDSASTAKPIGPARDIASAIRPLIGAPFQVNMNNRGEIIDVKLSDEAAKAFESAARDGRVQNIFSKDGLSETLRQSAALLPEQPVNEDDRWIVTNQTRSPLGTLKQTSTYTYQGTEDRDGQPLEKIAVESSLNLVNASDPAGPTVALKEQQHTGVLYFDAANGRFVSSQISQHLTTETPYRDTTIRVKVDSTMQMNISRAEKSAAAKPAQ
jgi:hypothetical protein